MIINLQHHFKHVRYVDVSMPPEAMQTIEEQVAWLTPSAMMSRIRAAYPEVSAAQVYNAWREHSQTHWRRDDLQLPSAKKLLTEYGDEVDIFEPVNVPEGVELLAWGMKKLAEPLKGKVFEIGMDATCKYESQVVGVRLKITTDNTNSKHLELYSVMAEHDNAGFPLTYCLLSTATAIDHHKRLKALVAWTTCLRRMYGINPIFAHVDKDMAEIGCLREVWNAKISLCWWHLRRAVRTRLAKAKLSTTLYDVKRAHEEFPFIDMSFMPPKTRVDVTDYEGGPPEDATYNPPTFDAAAVATTILGETSNSLRIRIPVATQQIESRPMTDMGQIADKENDFVIPVIARNIIKGVGFTLHLNTNYPISTPQIDKTTEVINDDEDEEMSRRTFCDAEYRESIVDMMERHYCAHPMIPGYAAPDPGSIKRWAVQQMYGFCVKHELPEVWAYLWENWYRKGRWELWARSVHGMIPILKTTMILESQ